MQSGKLTAREEEIFRVLLGKKGINRYLLIGPIYEGKVLPGSIYPFEIESISGEVITPTHVYVFWFDWIDGHYTLGDEDGSWEEISIEHQGKYRTKNMEIQRQLREEEEREVM